MKKIPLVWFGAAVSIAEIMTGTLLAPLGWHKGIFVIIIGHLIGCLLMYLVGLIGTQTGMGTMDSTSLSFGKIGSRIFAGFNALQLVGWTGIMIYSGASAAQLLLPRLGYAIWASAIALLILVWLIAYFKEPGILPTVTMALLFILTIIASRTVFTTTRGMLPIDNSITIWSGLELSIAMPLSWLPLIGDYTSEEKANEKIPLASAIVYFAASSWMYLLGLGCAMHEGSSDFALILKNSGLPVAGVLVIVLSTVTTTYLDAYSCGISLKTFDFRERPSAIICTAIGLLLALSVPSGSLEPFLYAISSIFVPMAAIQITDYFILRKNASRVLLEGPSLVVFLAGLLLYHYLLHINCALGMSIPVLIITSVLEICTEKLLSLKEKNKCLQKQ